MERETNSSNMEHIAVYIICRCDSKDRRRVYDQAFRDGRKARDVCNRLNAMATADGREGRYFVWDVRPDDDAEAWGAALGNVVIPKVRRCLKARRYADARKKFLTGCRVLFEKYPRLQSFGWHQAEEPVNWRRPDGMCDYYVTIDSPDINGRDGSDPDDKSGPEPEVTLRAPVRGFLRHFGYGILLDTFGNDVHITVHRDGRVEGAEPLASVGPARPAF